MNKGQAEALFHQNAVLMGGRDVIFDYKVTELFGESLSCWVFSCMGNFLKPGTHYSSWNDLRAHYFTLEGFMLIVSQHNYLAACEHTAQTIWPELFRARRAEIEALDAEDQRKREERRAKRAAARKAKQEGTT